jgi:hypothetical protein
MPITVKHTKVSTIPDDADTSLVRPSDWNADHTLVGLGTMAEQNANNVNITGGSITGVSGLGTVTSVTGTTPVVSSGGNTPAISIPAATTSVDGYLSATDWTTFNGKGNGTVTSITAGTGLTGGTITSTGTIAIDSTVTTNSATQTLTNKTLTNQTVTNYTETLHSPAAGSSFSVDLANGTVQKFTTNANTTVTLPSSVTGKSFVIIIAYGGSHSVTWAGGSVIKWAGGITPTATAVNGKFDIFTFFQDGTNTYSSVLGQNF